MDIKFNYDNFLIMDCEKFLSISHCFFPVSLCKNRIMLSVYPMLSKLVCYYLPQRIASLMDATRISLNACSYTFIGHVSLHLVQPLSNANQRLLQHPFIIVLSSCPTHSHHSSHTTPLSPARVRLLATFPCNFT